ncbi:FMRF-amide neuropeptides-like [Daktulosphaira vitifoliae]|uniref:FMRF-amide neuropeptides-like n=1 Tax=Daktulosphaira vitifoliae TaxID=58002 RepID=UPI0021AA8F18|nr:FMRF-amide neuropeptides-like [Daktulosphaira vitifoliae]
MLSKKYQHMRVRINKIISDRDMLLCLLSVAISVTALAADGGDADVDKRFVLRPLDPLTRRSALDKNFMRFGRALDCWTAAETPVKRQEPGAAVGRRLDSNFIRFGRRDSNFIRFGRGEVYSPNDNRIPRRHYDVDVDGLEVRFGRSVQKNDNMAARPVAAAVTTFDR